MLDSSMKFNNNPAHEETPMSASKNVNPNSIRQICLAGFLSGDKRDVIAARIKEQHPDSMAAQKSTVHIAWHYGDMKKKGLLDAILTDKVVAEARPVVSSEPAITEPTPPSADELIAELAAKMAANVDAELEATA